MADPPAEGLYLPHSRTCYVCGEANPLGLQRRFRLTADGAVEAEFLPRPEHCGYHQVVHGGILSALLDETMGWAPCVQGGRFCLSVELTLRFLRPAPPDRKLIVRGEVIEHRRRLWRAQGHIRDEQGTMYVRGSGTFYPLSREETEKVLAQLVFDAHTLSAAEILAAGDAAERQEATSCQQRPTKPDPSSAEGGPL